MNRINFREIARELNISHTTVYRVINNAHCVSDATRVRVIDALNRHGCYRDARVKPQTVLLDFDENAASSYMRDLLNLLRNRLAGNPFRWIETSHGTGRTKFLLACRDAHIVVFAPMADRDIYNRAKEVNPDLLILNLLDDAAGDIAIATDDFQGGQLAARRLYECGHRTHLAVTVPAPEDGLQHSFSNRAKGFLAEMMFLAPNCRIERWEVPLRRTRNSLPQKLKHKRRPSAVFATGLYFAKKTAAACSASGLRIPEDISLLGFDKPDCTEPPCDSIVFNPEQIVSWAEFFIMNRPVIKNGAPVHLLLDMKLETHGSVKRLNSTP